MALNYIKKLQTETGLSQDQLIKTLGLVNYDIKFVNKSFAELDAIIQTCVLNELDKFIDRKQNDIILIRYVSDYDFALYEEKLFTVLKCSSIHKAYINRTKLAIERIEGEVFTVFMDSNYYETWLGVNDFDDDPDIRITWAKQQLKQNN